MRKPLWYIKWTHFEYWPTWLLYLPSLFYYVYLAIKAKSLSYFAIVNPSIYLSGFHGESKADIFKLLPQDVIPKWFSIAPNTSIGDVLDRLRLNGIQFPLIMKPDKGCRGQGVHKIEDAIQLEILLKQINSPQIIQSFIDYEIELAVLYYHYPDGSKSGITSIALKEFMSVKGNGKNSILELMEREDRFRFQIEKEKQKLGEAINSVPRLDESVLLEPIGNHCRGTKFLNGNHLINDKLVRVFDCVMQNVEGIYFCRFDMRAKSIEDLYQGKNFSILELNGVGSDPAHIYDPSMSWLSAMQAINQNMKIVHSISNILHRKGIEYPSFSLIYREGKQQLL
jgi:hypothetical protein